MRFDQETDVTQLSNLSIAQTEPSAVGVTDRNRGHAVAVGVGIRRWAVDHFFSFAAQGAAQNRGTIGLQGLFVDVELIRVHSALYHQFTKPIGAGN